MTASKLQVGRVGQWLQLRSRMTYSREILFGDFMRLVLAFIALSVLPPAANAQECFNVTPELAQSAAKAVRGKGHCQIRCEGCGCKGGPGFRGPDLKCVGWANLVRVCGPPPYTKCSRECAPVVTGCADIAAEAAKTIEVDAAKPVSPKQGSK